MSISQDTNMNSHTSVCEGLMFVFNSDFVSHSEKIEALGTLLPKVTFSAFIIVCVIVNIYVHATVHKYTDRILKLT